MLKERAPNLISRVAENLEFLEGRPAAIDIDAVTQATYILALEGVSKTLGRSVQKDEIISYWELMKIVSEEIGLPEQEALDFAKDAWNRHSVYENSPEMPGIRNLLQIFNETETPYFFVSSRPTDFRETTQNWFRNTFPWVKSEDVILGRKEGEKGGDFKSEIIEERGAGLHIEDAPEEALIIADKAKVPVLLVPQPWNLQEPVDHKRIKHLGEYGIKGTWPVTYFLASKDAKKFLVDVAQY